MGDRSHGLGREDAVKKSDWYFVALLVVLAGWASRVSSEQTEQHEDYKASLDFCVETLARVNQGLSECVDIIDRVREMDGEIYK